MTGSFFGGSLPEKLGASQRERGRERKSEREASTPGIPRRVSSYNTAQYFYSLPPAPPFLPGKGGKSRAGGGSQGRKAPPAAAMLMLFSLLSFFHFMRLFWNQILICLSERQRACAISILLLRVRYLLK
ncbi:UNVERIFIED_CONTAM: hypothetical protein K2H54_040084 [Gekko kuhli]